MLYYDAGDYELLAEVRRIRACPPQELAQQLHPFLHPQGVQELCAHRAVRVAGAVATLLESLARAQAATRLQALRVLKEEALAGGNPALRRNTGRVLLQLMKDLVRTDEPARQLELARDFRTALTGRPRLIRRLLARYHLLEIPEDRAPASFDDHVHDASTKGRKTPAHLLLDAWIKGIAELTVVYYNHLPPEAGAELLEAAAILGIRACPAVEFPADFYGSIINLIWVPEAARSPRALGALLAQPPVQELMRLGRELSSLRASQLEHFLAILNHELLPRLRQAFRADLPELTSQGLAEVVADGQPSLLHIAQYLHSLLLLSPHAPSGQEPILNSGDLAPQAPGPEELKTRYLKPLADRYALRRSLPPGLSELPVLLREGVAELTARLRACGSPFRLLLSTTHLQAWDIPEILSLCRGSLTGLEVFNLKDRVNRPRYDTARINQLRLAFNRADITALKRLTATLQEELREANPPFCARRLEALRQVRSNLGALLEEYAGRPLAAVIGSDSAGRSRYHYGMGIAAVATLAPDARRRLRCGEEAGRLILPVRCRLALSTLAPQPLAPDRVPADDVAARAGTSGSTGAEPYPAGNAPDARGDVSPRFGGCPAGRLWRCLTGRATLHHAWIMEDRAAQMQEPGDLVTLGGLLQGGTVNGAPEDGCRDGLVRGLLWRWRNLNGRVRSVLKVLAGFLPAFLTFYLTRDWWVLACGGALIWFGITGVRNVLQAVLSAGGLHRSHLLRWRSLLDPGRIADSLFFTGLSVPLLDLFVRNLLLTKIFGLSAAQSPLLVFGTISLVNGLYISSHNYYRGLPRAAIIGNLFRSLLAIPLAMLINAGLEALLHAALVPAALAGGLAILGNCSAIVTKFASDTVACVIEGFADRAAYLDRRREEWRQVLRSFYTGFERLELALPDADGAVALASGELLQTLRERGRESVVRTLYAAALDMLYFWYCQPRSRQVLQEVAQDLSADQLRQLRAGLRLLEQEQTVCALLEEGLAGSPPERVLRFYRATHRDFLARLQQAATLPS